MFRRFSQLRQRVANAIDRLQRGRVTRGDKAVEGQGFGRALQQSM